MEAVMPLLFWFITAAFAGINSFLCRLNQELWIPRSEPHS